MGGVCIGRVRYTTLIKNLLFIGVGFCVRSLVDLPEPWSSPTQCPSCVNCDQVAEKELLKEEIHSQLREPFQPKTIYDVLRYDYFNMSTIFNNFDDDPRIGLLGHQKSDIKDILQQVLSLHNSAVKIPWKMSKFLNGYRRFDPLRGEEYILDVQLEPVDRADGVHEKRERFELVKPFGTVQMVSQLPIDDQARKRMMHFVVPVSSTDPQLEDFLQNFEEVCLKGQNADVYLLVVLFVDLTEPKHETRVQLIKQTLSSLSRRYRHGHVSVVQTKKPFSRPLGIDLGVKQLPGSALVFLCDVDIRLFPGFTTRCKQNAILNKQVYYPMVFAQYDPSVVMKYSSAAKYHHLKHFNKHTGHWLHDGYGVACMYAADYRSVGGMDVTTTGWTGEDRDLYQKHVKSNIEVFRSADPALMRVYHLPMCLRTLSPDQLAVCRSSQQRGSGSQLGELLIELPGDN